MSEGIFVVSVPQLGVNDDLATLVEWSVSDEKSVSVGQSLCALETTKAIFEIEAEMTGYIVQLVEAGDEVKISQPIALIGANLESLRAEKKHYVMQDRTDTNIWRTVAEFKRVTQKAIDLAQRLGVDLTTIPVAGIIRERDVLRYYEQTFANNSHVLLDLHRDSSRQPVVVYGAGKGGETIKECLDIQGIYQVVCFIDDNPLHPGNLCGLPVYHSSRLGEIMAQGIRSLFCAIASGSVRLNILRKSEELGIELINVIHPQAYIAPTVKIGEGNYIKARSTIDTNTVIGNCCIIDNGAIIAHDNIIGDGCHIAPGVVMGSSICIKELTIVGIGASVSTGINIGRSVIISVGTSVVKDVPDYAVVEGVPGKMIGKRKAST